VKRALEQLDALGRRVKWVEPPACHDPACGDCGGCTKRAPLSGALFRDVREAARRSGRGALDREVAELRDRSVYDRREDQLRRLQVLALEVERDEVLAELAAIEGGA
jgi:hypothetical protein